MSEMSKVISSNTRGKISYDITTELYHIEFGNVYLTLDFYQYKELEEIVEKLKVDSKISNSDNRVKIPFESDNFSWLLTPNEVADLKDLFGVPNGEFKSEKLKFTFSMN